MSVRLRLLAPLAAVAALGASAPEARATSCLVGPFILFFGRNQATFDREAEARLAWIIGVLESPCGSDGRVMIAGHTDRRGPAEYNLALSRRRAAGVRAYLVRHGIPAHRLKTFAFGETQPLNEPPARGPERENRRVEVTVGPPVEQ